MQRLRALLAIISAGLGFFYIETFLVGFSAAIAYPTWYAEFVARHSELGFALWDLFTVVPIVVVSALLVGAVLGRIVNRHFFVSGLAAVIVAIAYATAVVAPDLGLLVALRNHVFPVYWFSAPSYLAMWLALPLATMFFGARAKGHRIDIADASD
jgi:hypothetical protein